MKTDMPKPTYTVGQLSQLSGASVRALHHYESCGFLQPQRRENGYRAYGADDVARLQMILLFRSCGMELADIGKLLDDPGFDMRASLEKHLDVLTARKTELETLIDTVRKTLGTLEGETTMSDAERFEGLKRNTIEDNERTWGAEVRSAYGDAAVDEANEKLLTLNQEEWNDMNKLEEEIIAQLRSALSDPDPTSPAAKSLAALHARWIRMHWGDGAYSREAHLGLAQGYLADERFRTYYDSRAGEGATEFLVAALKANL